MPLTHRIESTVANTPVNAYLVEGERELVAIDGSASSGSVRSSVHTSSLSASMKRMPFTPVRLVMRSPDGEEFGGTGEFIEIERPERLVYSWTWDGHGAHEGTNLVEVEFRDMGDGTTLVVLTNRGLPDEDARRAHREGWQTSLDNLARVVRE